MELNHPMLQLKICGAIFPFPHIFFASMVIKQMENTLHLYFTLQLLTNHFIHNSPCLLSSYWMLQEQ
jgi:hypothetical protein